MACWVDTRVRVVAVVQLEWKGKFLDGILKRSCSVARHLALLLFIVRSTARIGHGVLILLGV